MNNNIHVKQCALIISMRCTLKCKLCLVYAPYYKNPKDYSLEEISKSVDKYFDIIDSCGTFNIQGGEPLLHPNLPEIILKVLEYKDCIGKILITTNGTLLPSAELLKVLKTYSQYIQVNISDYGPSLSRQALKIVEILHSENIPYRVICYHGENLHFGGWLDFTDHTLKYHSEAELIENAKQCGYRDGGNIAIRGNELYFCYRVARRVELGLIEKNEASCLQLFDGASRDDQRQHIKRLLEAPYTPACAYCFGKRESAVHHPPAVQLSPEEIVNGVEKFDKT